MSLGISRLAAQHIGAARVRTVHELVAWLLAVQAQDPLAARWAVGARVPGVTERDVIAALDEGRILRTHVMRGTWQYVVPEDLRWLLSLFGPKVRASAARRHAQLGLDGKTLSRSEALLEKALAKQPALTREAARDVLETGGVSTKEQRLSHLLVDAELSGLLCSGPHEDGKATWALVDKRVGLEKKLPQREELLARLATRFFESRGPATLEDFRWWTGLTAGDAKSGLESAKATLQSKRVGERTLWWREDHEPAVTHGLLPAFDEFLIGYQNRDDVLEPGHVKRINAGGGLLAPSCTKERSSASGDARSRRRPWRSSSTGSRSRRRRSSARCNGKPNGTRRSSASSSRGADCHERRRSSCVRRLPHPVTCQSPGRWRLPRRPERAGAAGALLCMSPR